jgi:hypothetical protein
MRHGLFVLLTLPTLIAAAPAYAQSRPSSSPLSEADVVARMMSFDRNSDGRIQKPELAERMHVLLARGDTNKDAALDGKELRTLAGAKPRLADQRVIILSGSYLFADEIEFSSRLRIEGALDDLRLGAATRERAGAVAASYAEALEEKTAAELIGALDEVLETSQLLDVVLALGDRRDRAVETINGALVVAVKAGSVTTERGKDLLRRIAGYGLSVQQQMAAEAAIERYDARIRLGEPERGELLAQLQDLLGEEERENLGAALARRPVVPADGMVR